MNIAQPIVVRSFNVISQQANIKEIEMNTYKPISALTSVLMLSTALSGCATFGKCGLSGCPEDAKITSDVETRLWQDTATGSPNEIYVSTANHVVYLSGLTATSSEKAEAEADAGQISGVKEVVNTIVGHFP